MKQQTDMAEESRIIGVSQCAEEKHYQLVYGAEQEVADGEFNACRERVEIEHRNRVAEIVNHDEGRYLKLGNNVDELISECIGPSPDDLVISNKPRR